MDTNREREVLRLVQQARGQAKGNFLILSAFNALEALAAELAVENKRLTEQLQPAIETQPIDECDAIRKLCGLSEVSQ
jgi:hypothetical protein